MFYHAFGNLFDLYDLNLFIIDLSLRVDNLLDGQRLIGLQAFGADGYGAFAVVDKGHTLSKALGFDDDFSMLLSF